MKHVYPINHKLKDCGLMKNLMTSVSLTQDREPEKDPGRSDAMPFHREDAVMMIYDGCPPPRRHRMSSLESQGLDSLWLGTRGHRCVKAHVFHNIYIYIPVYYSHSKRIKQQAGQPEAMEKAANQSSDPGTSASGMLLSQVLQNQSRRRQDLLAVFGRWGMSRIGNVPTPTRELEISMTNFDSFLASAAHSSSTLATHT
jgi:hypothetical protein